MDPDREDRPEPCRTTRYSEYLALVGRLRTYISSQVKEGWTLTWDVRNGVVETVIATGGLEAFIKAEVAKSRGHQIR
ncbi:hypothetical protein F5Y07DRAFT_399952 [Xylaria sp. FL0933]|nr:hypothetical protein F5Y07DRAFT_399952 [Xylaria sp. FL0933]